MAYSSGASIYQPTSELHVSCVLQLAPGRVPCVLGGLDPDAERQQWLTHIYDYLFSAKTRAHKKINRAAVETLEYV